MHAGILRLLPPLCVSWLLVIAGGICLGDEPLPRVLLLGDASYAAATRPVLQHFSGKATVVYAHPGDSTTALERLDELLGEEPWQVIHFNFGLADLHAHDPASREVRAMDRSAGGVPVTTPDRYRANLEAIVQRLKQTHSRLIWASTVPIPPGYPAERLYEAGSELAYNAIAADCMQRHGIPVNDLHAFILANVPKDRLAGAFKEKYKKVPLHEPMIEAIERELGKR